MKRTMLFLATILIVFFVLAGCDVSDECTVAWREDALVLETTGETVTLDLAGVAKMTHPLVLLALPAAAGTKAPFSRQTKGLMMVAFNSGGQECFTPSASS